MMKSTDKNNSTSGNYKPKSLGECPESSNISQQKGEKVFRWLLILFAILVFLIMAVLVLVVSFDTPEIIGQWVDSARTSLTFWRLMLFLLLIGGWRYWSEIYAHGVALDDAQLRRMVDYRWRIALWLLIMEAVFSQNIVSDLFASTKPILGN